MNADRKPMPLTRPAFDETELEALRACLDSGWVTQGPFVSRFEALMAEQHRMKHALAVTSCTAALHVAAEALELGPGDEVIIPAFTWITSAHSAEYVGAKAVFADVDLATFNIDPAAFEAAITPRTKAAVAVHLFGLAAPMDEVLAIARKHGLRVIEDGACAIGTTWQGTPVGGIGDIGCFSFHPRKAITTGEGGAVTTNDDDLARRSRYIRNHGATGNPASDPTAQHAWTMAEFDARGYNLRLSDIQAAVGVAQFAKLEALLDERRSRADRYHALLADVPDLIRPAHPQDKRAHTYQSFVILIREGGRDRRNAVMTALTENRIQSRPGTHAVPRLGYYKNKYGLEAAAFPNAVTAEDTSITLPIFPGMTDADQDQVVAVVRSALARSTR